MRCQLQPVSRALFSGWLILAGLLQATVAQGAELGAEQDQTAAALQQTIQRLNALDEWFTDAERKRSIWLVELQRQDLDISKLNVEVQSARADLTATELRLTELKQEVETTNALKTSQAERIASHVAAAYRLTGQDFLKQLLNQESPDKLDRMMRYHRFFSASRLQVMAEYRVTLENLVLLDE